ncbi:MAG: sigma factor-like helix-turn-helix DNA-binding protein [Bacilli bacterium]
MLEEILNSVERCVIHGLYTYERTQRETADSCSLSPSAVSRTHARALVKLRRAMKK